MKKFLFTLLVVGIVTNLKAQSFGYHGRKNLISLEAKLSYPIFYMLTSFDFSYFNMDKAVNVSYGRILNPNFAIHLNYESWYYKFVINGEGTFLGSADGNGYGQVVDCDAISANRKMIMPVFEWTAGRGSVPAGIGFQFGVGLGRTKVDPTYSDVRMRYNVNSSASDYYVNYQGKKVYDKDLEPIHMFSIMAKPIYRLPIGKSLLFNIGYSYSLNLTTEWDIIFPSSYPNKSSTKALMSRRSMKDEVNYRELRSFSSISMGFTFAL